MRTAINEKMQSIKKSLNKSKPKFLAFTLAEVLITLGIIGIVAALTIPTVINSTQDKEFSAALKEFYSILEQAELSMQGNNEAFLTPLTSSTDNYNLSLLAKYINFSKLCYNGAGSIYGLPSNAGTPAAIGCWYYDKDANPAFGNSNTCGWNMLQCYAGESPWSVSGIFANGMTIAIADDGIIVDINGFKKPNTPGKDVYEFDYNVTSKKFMPVDLHAGLGKFANAKTRLLED